MLGDVAAGGRAGVGAQEVAEAVGVAEEIEDERLGVFFGRAGEGGGVVNVEEKPGDDGGEVGRLPIAVDVGLGETDVAGEHAFFEEGVALHADMGGGGESEGQRAGEGVGVGADFVRDAVGELHPEVAAGHAGKGAEEGGAVETGFGAPGEIGGGARGGRGGGLGTHTASDG